MTNKDSYELVLAIVAVIIGGAGLTVASIALAFTIGIKNSTHQVIWKPVEEPKAFDSDDDDAPPVPGFEGMLDGNPNKKIKFEKFENNIPKDEAEFADLSDPSVTSNNY